MESVRLLLPPSSARSSNTIHYNRLGLGLSTKCNFLRIDATSCKEVRQFLSHVTDCLMAGNLSDVPSVIILEDLHLATSLNDVFSPLARLESSQDNLRFPYVIGTTGPMTQSSAQLQLQFNFRYEC